MCAKAIGIDLGTTNSCVAVFEDGKVHIIENEEGSYVIPSCVTFTDEGILTGHEAVSEARRHVKTAIFEIKRLLGQRFEDPKVQLDAQKFPYKVVNDNGVIKIEVTHNGETQNYFPEEISAFVLKKLKDLATAYLGHDVNQVVVTVPAYFNDSQRQATKDAASIAGFKRINIINEPTAAALAFTYHNSKPYKRNVLVYDFGGGTFDVSIITVGRGKCEVKATKGDLHLGGTDIDNNLIEFIREDFKKQFGEEINQSKEVLYRLRNACESVKKKLSGKRRTAEIELYSLSDKDYMTSITREEFEEINAELFARTLKVVEECLNISGLTKNEIDEVVLVGGSSKIPKVQEMLTDYFGSEKISKGVNPDEAVAYGAAIQAVNLVGNKDEIKDVIPLSLGIAIRGFLNSIIIPSNTSIPTNCTERYETADDNQTEADIVVYQGEEVLVKNNHKLGEFTLVGLRKAPAGQVNIDVCFKVDAEGILSVTASEVDAHNMDSIKIDVKRSGLSPDEIEQKIEKMTEHHRNELKRREFALAKYELEQVCHGIMKATDTIEDSVVKLSILNECHKISNWLQSISINDLDEVDLKENMLKNLHKAATS